MTDNRITEPSPEGTGVDVAFWLLKKASGGKSMWEDPKWDYSKKGGAEFRAAHPAHLNKVPYMHQGEPVTRSRTRESNSPVEGLAYTATNLSATEFKPATTSTSRSFSPQAHGSKPVAAAEMRKPDGYVPPHLRGWGEAQSDGIASPSSVIRNTPGSAVPPHSVKPPQSVPRHLRTTAPKLQVEVKPQSEFMSQAEPKPEADSKPQADSEPQVESKQQVIPPHLRVNPTDNIPPHLRTIATKPQVTTAKEPKPENYIAPHLRTCAPNQKPSGIPKSQAPTNGVEDLHANINKSQAVDKQFVETNGPDNNLSTGVTNSEDWKWIGKDVQTPGPAKQMSYQVDSRSAVSLEGRVSNTGVSEGSLVFSGPKEVIRAEQGRDPKEQLLSYDGVNWNPPPVDWEYDRGMFDTSYIPAYCKEWASQLPGGQVLAMNDDRFISGKCPVKNYQMIEEVEQPVCTPDIDGSCDEFKRLNQCSANAAESKKLRIKKERQNMIKLQRATEERIRETEELPPPPNPHAPATEVYLRPALRQDLPGIVSVYNQYVKDMSLVQDDQEAVTEDEMWSKLAEIRGLECPIIVAIEGGLPTKITRGPKENYVIPSGEKVIGFAWIEPRAYGAQISKKSSGRSRYTGLLNLFVHTQFLRKGIGRCLMDRILQCTSLAHAELGGYEWINPKNDRTCIRDSGGSRSFHDLLVEYPIRSKQDYTWVQNYLRRWQFLEQAHLHEVARSSKDNITVEWLDIIVFQTTALSAHDFAAHI
ncbi:acyl-n-acyltransferase [Phlyctema vagabunda]|uniref:Acyl-n-acyltransferase n=1 Tax=Phlyctema vagabunda TaxID=108571 RepID=A0ABR4PRC4_9HELO